MEVQTFKCPHCGNNLGTAVDAYLYGSPFRVCNKCKNSYVDNRYHEIAIEGIRQEDIYPTENDKKSHRKSGWKSIWIGIGSIVLFVIILFTGWIVFPLPIIGFVSIIGGVRKMKSDTKKSLEKTRAALEIEKQQSFLRLQDPLYVEKLRSIGYNIPYSEPSSYVQQPRQNVCTSCGTPLNENDRFCPTCGTQR